MLAKALATAPALAISTALIAVLASLLPGPLPGLVVCGLVGAALVATTGVGEAVAVRWLFRARPLTLAEQAALTPAVGLLCQRGLGPPLVRLYLSPALPLGAHGVGRRSVLVSAELVAQVRLGQLAPEEVAAVLAHSAALVRVGVVRSDLALRLWLTPWRFMRGLCSRPVGAADRLPLVRLLWRSRFVVGLVALVQGTAASTSAEAVAGAFSAAVVVLSYLVPRWERAWRDRLQQIGDEQVAREGLAPALAARLLRCSRSAATYERVHALEQAHASAQTTTQSDVQAYRARRVLRVGRGDTPSHVPAGTHFSGARRSEGAPVASAPLNVVEQKAMPSPREPTHVLGRT